MDLLIRGGRVMTADARSPGIGLLERGAVLTAGKRVRWVGREADLPGGLPEHREVDLKGGCLTPALVDCHTHLVFGGDRSDEFERRLAGESYREIARSGGGIRSTMVATAGASIPELVAQGLPRARDLAAGGVGTVEIKSGYALDPEGEVRMLRAAREIGERLGLRVRTTFLGLHTLPPGYEGRREAWVREAIHETLPRVAAEGLAQMADAFLEDLAFTRDECLRFLTAAREAGLTPRLHADQLSDSGGARLAAEVGASSADHLEFTGPEGAEAMAGAGTTAVLLPGAYYTLGQGRPPPVERFRALGIPMAVATDLNPGSSPVRSLPLAMNQACLLFGLTVEEALLGVTRHAARVLGLEGGVGILAPGARADLAVWELDHPRDLVYWTGGRPLRSLWVEGRQVLP